MKKYLFTSESVTEGHPDKVCDQISDGILDAYLEKDSNARVACETAISSNLVLVMGEITSKHKVDVDNIVRKTLAEIGYINDEYGFNFNTCNIIKSLRSQSEDISIGVDYPCDKISNDLGAGDQGMMFGYACDETLELMPLPIFLAHKLTKRISIVRKTNIINYLRPDGKAQVTVEYLNDVPIRIDTIIVSVQHNDNIPINKIEKDLKKFVINEIIPPHLIDKKTRIYINPTGRFVLGGPFADSGLTGRKIIVDTYGGFSRHGGGAFSGKDPTKVDRSAAYFARFIAKNIVATKIAKRCEIGLAYAIGMISPVSLTVNTFGTSKLSENTIKNIIINNIDLSPKNIITILNLNQPIYKQTACYGHFGRNDLDLPWEKIYLSNLFEKYIDK
ncbi:methionine adenosyltransferase [Vallitalea sediminicola]